MTGSDRIFTRTRRRRGRAPCGPSAGGRWASRRDWPALHGVWLVAIAALCGTAGCGTGAAKLASVEGGVTLDGQPLAGAEVRFHPVGMTKGRGAVGRTDAEGHFRLIDVRQAAPGVISGEYHVTVSKRLLADGGEIDPNDPRPLVEIPAKESLPPAYSQEGVTTLAATVPPGGTTVDFALQRRPAKK